MRLNVSIAAAALAALSRTAAVNASKSSIPQDCAITSLTGGFAVSAVKPSSAISRRIPRRVRHSPRGLRQPLSGIVGDRSALPGGLEDRCCGWRRIVRGVTGAGQLKESSGALDIPEAARHVVDRRESGRGRALGRFAQLADQRVSVGALGQCLSTRVFEPLPDSGLANLEDAPGARQFQELAGRGGAAMVLRKIRDRAHRTPFLAARERREQQVAPRERAKRVLEAVAEGLAIAGVAGVVNEQDVERGTGRGLAAGEIAQNHRRDPALVGPAAAVGKSSSTAESATAIAASPTLASALPASIGVRLPRKVCMPIWKVLSFDQFRTASTASLASCTGASAICSFISATPNSRVQ